MLLYSVYCSCKFDFEQKPFKMCFEIMIKHFAGQVSQQQQGYINIAHSSSEQRVFDVFERPIELAGYSLELAEVS